MTIYVDDKEVEFSKFPNGESIVPDFPDGACSVRLHWTGDHDLLQLAFVKGMLDQNDPRIPLILWIDYMPYSRMDREEAGHCFSLAYVAHQINAMYWDEVHIVEPHSQVTLDLVGHSRPVWATAKLIPFAMERIGFDMERDCIVFPDAGAQARYGGIAEGLNVVVLKKKRDFDTGKILGLEVADADLREGTGSGCKALIVDDLSSRGGTFIGAAGLLRERGIADSVSLLVTHMEPVGLTGGLPVELDRVFCTDTMDFPRPVPANFEVFPRSYWT